MVNSAATHSAANSLVIDLLDTGFALIASANERVTAVSGLKGKKQCLCLKIAAHFTKANIIQNEQW